MAVIEYKKKNITETSILSKDGIKIGEKERLDRSHTSICKPKLDETKTFYIPSISIQGLNKTSASNGVLSGAHSLISRSISSCLKPNKLISRSLIEEMMTQYLYNGNIYLFKNPSLTGKTVSLDLVKSEMCRVGLNGEIITIHDNPKNDSYTLKKWDKENFIHIKYPSAITGIYGIPSIVGVLHQIWLGNEAVLFRRKYYINGAHMGYLIEIDANGMTKKEIKEIENNFKRSKGPGNFSTNLIITKSREKTEKNRVNLIPLGDITANDQFDTLKKSIKDDLLLTLGVPVVLMGGVPSEGGNLGDPVKALETFGITTIDPFCLKIKDQFEREGVNVDFHKYSDTIKLIKRN